MRILGKGGGVILNNGLDIKNLTISYDRKKVVNNVSYHIQKNKITAIIGPSGCGKTTLLKSLNRLIEEIEEAVTEGEILLDNIKIRELPINNVRKRIGMVFQQPSPFPLTIYKNISYALKYYGTTNSKKLNDSIIKVLKRVGLYDEIRHDLHTNALNLSGGQQQRLCIARAIAIHPEILLLDEPCSALDVQNTSKIEELLKKLVEDNTIVIVTHNLAQAKRISDNTIFMLDGKIVEAGTTDQIFNNPKDDRTKQYLQGLYG